MKNFLQTFWRVITWPFRMILRIIAWPFRMIGRGIQFLNTDVDDRPILDTFSNLATETDARASFWEHVEALRMHLLRMLIALALCAAATSQAATVTVYTTLAAWQAAVSGSVQTQDFSGYAAGANLNGVAVLPGVTLSSNLGPVEVFGADKIAVAFGKDPKIQALAQNIIKAQEDEIAMMRLWLAQNVKQ